MIKNHPFQRIEIADGDIDEMDNTDEFSSISESFLNLNINEQFNGLKNNFYSLSDFEKV